MASRLYHAVLRWKTEQGAKGGRGQTSPSKFVRLPEDVLSELDDLIQEFYLKYGDYPDSPRNKRLFELLFRLTEIFPP